MPVTQGRPPLFDATIPTTTTQFIGVPIHNGVIGLHIIWTNAGANATITLEFSSLPPGDAPVGTAGTYQWRDSGLTFTGPTGAAVGSTLVNVENARQQRARLKVVTTASTSLIVMDGIQST